MQQSAQLKFQAPPYLAQWYDVEGKIGEGTVSELRSTAADAFRCCPDLRTR